jgi:hypothetical protein
MGIGQSGIDAVPKTSSGRSSPTPQFKVLNFDRPKQKWRSVGAHNERCLLGYTCDAGTVCANNRPSFELPALPDRLSAMPRNGVTDVTFLRSPCRAPMRKPFVRVIAMNILGLCLVVQLGLAFGLAGLFWPDKFRPLFDILLFPWAASCGAIRANSIVAIGLSLLLLVTRLTGHA